MGVWDNVGSQGKPIADHVSHGFWGGVTRFFGNAVKKAEAYLGALPQLPSHLVGEANRGVQFLAGGHAPGFMQGSVPGENLKFQWRGFSHLPFGHTPQVDPASKGPRSYPELLSSIHKEGFWKPVLELPIVDLIPGTYTAKQVSKGVMPFLKSVYEDPAGQLLDILPFASEATGVVTKGSGLAEEAATHAEDVGKIGTAAKIAKKGLTIPQTAGQIGRRVESRIEGRFPKAHNYLPSDMLARSGLGGSALKQQMRMLGEARSHFNAHLSDELVRLADKHSEFGLSTDDVERLTHEGTFPTAGWRDRLKPNEKAYVDWIESEHQALKDLHPNEWIRWEGHDYLKSDYPKLAQPARAIERGRAAINELRDRILVETNPVKLNNYKRRLTGRLRTYEKNFVLAQEAFQRAVPAKYKPMIVESIKPEELKILAGRGPVDPHIQDLIHNDLWREAGITQAERDALISKARDNWRQFENLDPLYTHHVHIDQVKAISHPPLFTRQIRPADLKHLAWDMKPWVENASVAVSKQWADHVRFVEVERFAEIMRASKIVKTQAEVLDETSRWAAMGAGRGKTLRERADSLQSHYEVYDPKIFMQKEGGVASGGKGDFYIPKELSRAIESVRPKENWLNSAALPLRAGTRLFRLSYLFFRPFYYVHINASGMVMALATGGPRDLLMLPKTLDMLRSGDLPAELSLGFGRMGEERIRNSGLLGDELLRRYQTLGDTRAIARKVENFTHKLASTSQDMWKATSYLAEVKRRSRSFTPEQAVSLAVEHANRVFMSMDELVPFERTIVRQVVPFYAWSKHLLSFVSSYPFDHPWRAAVVTGIGRAVIEDWQQQHPGLPTRFMHYFMGPQNRKGQTMLFPASGVMPFVQVADMLSMAGFMSRLDPRIKALLESRGIDTYSGGPVPDYLLPHKYDEEKGKEVAVLPSLFSLMMKDMIGQTDPFFASSDLQQYYAKNPDRRREAILRALIGASPMYRDLQAEVAKAEKAQKYTQKDEARRLKRAGKSTGSSGGPGIWK